MPWVNTATDLRDGISHPQGEQVYNGLDCMITLEVHGHLDRLIMRNDSPEPRITYGFERALQGPALDMMLRGFKVDEIERRKAIAELEANIVAYGGRLSSRDKFDPDSVLQQMAYAIWDRELNPKSPVQLIEFFYRRMRLPEIWTSHKGVRKLSMDREALEKLSLYLYARPLINCILAIRDLSKQRETLLTEVDPDGRMRTSYNIAGTETGRWSSSGNAFGTGGNLQNLADKLRKIFVADPGWKICGIDLEQAESREVGWLSGTLFGDWRYLDATETGDLHTYTSQLIWPGLGWTNDPDANRRIAEQPYYRDMSYRDMAKRGGHGSNYLGTPFTMARHLKVPTRLMEGFQSKYFDAFPSIPRWHQWVAKQLQTTQLLRNAFDRTRHFFGRPNDDATLREAIAFGPQSSTADRLNLILWRVWRYMPEVELLAQVHDALYFQFRETSDELAVVNKALRLCKVPLERGGRTFDVPGEAKVGWNWGRFDPKLNPDGLTKLKGQPDSRKRLALMERPL